MEDFVFWSVSDDQGETWSAMTPVACAWEPHVEASAPLTVLDDGTWATPITGFPTWEGTMTGSMCGRLLRSEDEGKTWSRPISTGVRGQASSVCALGGDRLLALHAVRRDTERPGIYGYVVDFSHRTGEIQDKMLIWEPETPVLRDDKMAEVFAYLKFGQPGAIRTRDGRILMSCWYAQDGQYKTVCTRIEI